MGWRGAIRSIGAAVRAAEREALRQQRIQLREDTAAESAGAVAALEDFQRNLITVHTKLADPIDWRLMATSRRPAEPAPDGARERETQASLAAFRPSFFDVFRGGSEKVRERLEAAVISARSKDEEEFEAARSSYAAALADWEADVALAKRLLDGNAATIKSVLEEMQAAMQGDGYVGSHVTYDIEPGFVHARPSVHGVDVIPAYRRKQLASGRLSQTKRPVGEFNELYQDYVCSVALKVGGDLFRILPLSEVYVTCQANMVNPRNGHMEEAPILSVHFVRSTYESLSLATVDPSEAMRNFRHAMAFKKAQGFSRVEPLVRAA